MSKQDHVIATWTCPLRAGISAVCQSDAEKAEEKRVAEPRRRCGIIGGPGKKMISLGRQVSKAVLHGNYTGSCNSYQQLNTLHADVIS